MRTLPTGRAPGGQGLALPTVDASRRGEHGCEIVVCLRRRRGIGNAPATGSVDAQQGAAMIYLYLFALVLGGVLLGASLILGGHGAPGEGDASADGAAHPDAPDEAGVESLLVAFLSLRFWTFFLAFFGLTGVVLDGLGLVASSLLAAVLSAAMGVATGAAAVWVMRRVRGDETNSAAIAKDYVGRTGRVLVGLGPGKVGKVRLEVRGASVDLLCVPIDGQTVEPKEEVIVVEMDGTHAKVAKLASERPSAR